METALKICNRIIEYSFYCLFLFVPLFFTNNTYELFEFNKMWLVFGLTLVITGAWFAKMILQKRIVIQKTPLDIPILLFLASQIISTIFSLDTHVSIWGYYSRFNGSLLSIISYIFLYYAFVSNFSPLGAGERQDPDAITMVKRLLKISLIAGLIVALWGLPSHFGYDPTCFMFRGTFDVSCWTDAFQPKIRMFSTLGQPDWLAAYLAILIPLSIAFGLKIFQSTPNPQKTSHVSSIKYFVLNKKNILATLYILLTTLFYLCLLYTDARSGFIAIWVALILFFTLYLYSEKEKILNLRNNPKKILLKYWYLLVVLVFIGSITFFIETPIVQINKFTFAGIKEKLLKITQKPVANPNNELNAMENKEQTLYNKINITDSSKIRFFVWQGAIEAWKNHPLFGTGVETFAFAYYRYKPAGHNLTSEWDYLYNKAHNEYLNYLTTTGIFGLGSYLLMIGWFLYKTLKHFLFTNDHLKKDYQKSSIINNQSSMLIFALVSGYVSILITNFFGFSVVIISLYFFLIPAFILILNGLINPKNQLVFPKIDHLTDAEIKKRESFTNVKTEKMVNSQWAFIIITVFIASYLLFNLIKFWLADVDYATGYNLNKSGQFQDAYQYLTGAVAKRGNEPVFKDELFLNIAILGPALMKQKEAANNAALLVDQAVKMDDEIISQHPNNVVFWKTRVRGFYSLSQINPKYLNTALSSIEKAHELAPADAKIAYNFGIVYGQTGNTEKAITVLEETIKLKPDYRDAYYALGILYYDAALDKNGRIVKPELQKKAVETMRFILENISGNDGQVKEILKNWGEN